MLGFAKLRQIKLGSRCAKELSEDLLAKTRHHKASGLPLNAIFQQISYVSTPW